MPDKIGKQIGNYHLTRLLGSGGFADVYLGQHMYLRNMLAAIKMLHTQVVEEKLQEDFLREAETIALLKHPNIIRLLDFGIVREGTTPYLIMDYAPHGTLRNHYPKGSPVPLRSVVIYVKQIASALQYAHDRDLIHRDLKPENLLIGNHGEILLSDFGIAAIAHSTSTLSASDYAGTIPYSAPEQIQGKPRRESDQYSLGIMVYEWLSGERPFQGTWSEIISQHIGTPPPLLHEKVSDMPLGVERVIMKALAKDPRQRFESVQTFSDALGEAAQSSTNTETYVSTIKDIEETHREDISHSTQHSTEMFSSTRQNIADNATLPSPRKRGLDRRSFSLFAGGTLGLISLLIIFVIIIGPLFMSLQQRSSVTPTHSDQPVPSNHPVEKWIFPTGNFVWSTPTVVDDVVYIGSNDTNLYAINAHTGKQKWVFPTGNWVVSSPTIQSDMLYIGSGDNNVYGIDESTGLEKWVFSTEDAVTSSPVIANGILYVGSFDHKVYAIDASTGKQKWAFPTGDSIWGSATVVNGILYIGSYDHKVYAIDAVTGRLRWTFPTGDKILSSPTIVNGTLYIGSHDDRVYAINATTGQLKWAFSTGNAVQSIPTVVNGILYIGSYDHKVYAIDATTGQLKWAFPTGDYISATPAVINGILYIGSHDHKVYAIDANMGHEKWIFSTGDAVSSPSVVNRILYVGSNDHKVYALALPTSS